jgi:hypothetical protein
MTPGLRTSEFKVAVLTAIGSIAAGLADWVPNRYALIGSVLAGIGYILSRGHAKSGTPTP